MCLNCNRNNFPFSDVNTTNQEKNFNREFLASENLRMFFKDMNDFECNNNSSLDANIDLTPIINCKYLEVVSLKSQNCNSNSFSMIHLNIHSLEKK